MTPAEIQSQLTRVLGSALFLSAPELSELLRYLVQQGDARNLEDPVLREVAERLRQRLREYYAGVGREDPVIIELPDAGYTPRFSMRPAPAPAPAPPKRRPPAAIPVAVALLAAAAGAYGWWRHTHAASPAGAPVIAVLPFSTPPQTAELGAGFTKELIAALTRCRGVGVMAPDSAFSAAAKDLSVTTVLRGTLQATWDTVQVSAELERAGKRLWAGAYERRWGELGEVEQAVVSGIAAALNAQPAALPRGTADGDARRLYLAALAHGDVHGLEQATGQDPNFAAAWAARGDAYQRAGDSRAEAVLRRALGLDDSLSEAHAALGDLRFYRERNFGAAEGEYRRAIELAPGSADAHRRYGLALTWRGRFPEAASELRRARELDPLSAALSNDIALLDIYSGRLDDAREQTRQTLAWEPRDYTVHVLRGVCDEQEGLFRNAVHEFEQAVELSGRAPDALAHLGHAFGLSGMRPEALSIARRMESPYRAATVYAGLREPQEAIASLGRALAEGDPLLVRLPFDPDFNPMHSDPGFGEFLRKAGLR